MCAYEANEANVVDTKQKLLIVMIQVDEVDFDSVFQLNLKDL